MAQQCPDICQRYTAVYTLWSSEIAMGHGAEQRSVHSDCATMMMINDCIDVRLTRLINTAYKVTQRTEQASRRVILSTTLPRYQRAAQVIHRVS